jgi:hypothetical protein
MIRTAVRSLVAITLAAALAAGLTAPTATARRPFVTSGQGCCLVA